MLRQLARLTRPLPAAGPGALAMAVYSDESGEALSAAEAGFEGVACVDDAARACELLCDLWEVTRLPSVRAWAEGLLDFLLWAHDGGGRWVNFIYDWDGELNRSGRTSVPGANFWQARALNAMAAAWTVLGDGRAEAAFKLGLRVASSSSPPPDVRALHATAALRASTAGVPGLEAELVGWADEIAACRIGDVLMNSAEETGGPHLWGHVQEGVVAEVGSRTGRWDLVRIGELSAAIVFGDLIRSGFEQPHIQPYGVQSAVYVMDRLAAATGREPYRDLGRLAREWFDGRNPAGVPVYDRAAGLVADGIDEGILNAHSGAESNIAGALALPADAAAIAGEAAESVCARN